MDRRAWATLARYNLVNDPNLAGNLTADAWAEYVGIISTIKNNVKAQLSPVEIDFWLYLQDKS